MEQEWKGDGLHPEDIITYDPNQIGVPSSVKMLKPMLYKDGDAFCLLAGPDPQSGTFGCGPTVESAMEDFEQTFKKGENASKKG